MIIKIEPNKHMDRKTAYDSSQNIYLLYIVLDA